MKHYLIALNGFGELLKRRYKGGSLLDYAKKENFDRISGRGKWGYLHLGKTLERAYWNLFEDDGNFPGESFLRAGHYGIPVNEGQTSFLSRFMMQVDGRVLESGVELTEKEKYGLLEALSLSGGNRKFEFHVRKEETILVFNKNFSEERVLFPCEMKGREFARHSYKNKDLEEVSRIIKLSAEILPLDPINKVKEDLGELSANLLWLWGQGRKKQIATVGERTGRETFYMPLTENSFAPAELLGFKRITDIRETENNSLTWINSSLDPGDAYTIWLRQFENFDRDILGEILREYRDGKCRVLLVFDGFLSPDAETRNIWGVFLALGDNSFSRFSLKKYYKNGRSFVEKIIA